MYRSTRPSLDVHPSRVRGLARAWAMLAVLALAGCSVGSATDLTPTIFSMIVSGGTSQNGAAGLPLASPIIVLILDQTGTPMSGIPVTLTTSPTSGTVSSPTATTDATGSVTVTWTLGKTIGTDSLTVVAVGVPNATVLAFAHAGDPANLSVVSGSGQTGVAGSRLPAPLTVKVTDQFGNPVSNTTVLWSNDANGTFASATEVTDVDGIAQNTYVLGPNPGPQSLASSVWLPTGMLVSMLTEIAQ